MMSLNLTMVLIQCYIYSRLYRANHKKHGTFHINSPIHISINRINNRLVFKIEDGYKLELQRPKTMKLFGSTKNSIDKKRNRKNVPSL